MFYTEQLVVSEMHTKLSESHFKRMMLSFSTNKSNLRNTLLGLDTTQIHGSEAFIIFKNLALYEVEREVVRFSCIDI